MTTPTSSSEHLIRMLQEIGYELMRGEDSHNYRTTLHKIADFWEGQNKATVAALSIFQPDN